LRSVALFDFSFAQCKFRVLDASSLSCLFFAMTSVQLNRQVPFRPRLATLVMLGMVGLAAAIAVAWFMGNGTITTIFEQLHYLQEHPPAWAMTPMVVGHFFLFWAAGLMVLVLAITHTFPQPTGWPRTVVVGVLIVLTWRYFLWRATSTLNLETPLQGVFSLGLFFLELLILTSGSIQLLLLLKSRDRRREADILSGDVLSRDYVPTVDIFIPTYDEPEFILRRTIMGCQAIDYGPKTIYLLDDTRRSAIRALAAELGCEYMTRPDNRHAKAGNLNHAIPQTGGELLVVFDADFVPTRNFLTRTVGFFQDEAVALVQTPQSFYNPDPIAYNLGLEDVLTPEEEVFYRQVQRVRDGAGAVVCAGTSFVMRRSALASVGGFVTEAVSEDFFTGIQLAAKGYKLVYLNEKLSAGLAAENIAAHALQRVRWEQGTLQSFFIRSNPLTIPGLSLVQRLAYFEGLLHWFTSIARVGFLIMPLAYSFLGVIPLQTNGAELLYFFLPFYLVQLAAFSWLNYRSRSALLSDVYALVLAFPLAITAFQVMVRPFSRGFKVTPKGTSSQNYRFNWPLAWPLVIVFILTALSLWINLGNCLAMMGSPATHLKGLGVGWLWSGYNLIMLSIALLILLDAPRQSRYEWFKLQRVVSISVEHEKPGHEPPLWGITTQLSEEGGKIALTCSGEKLETLLNAPITVRLEDELLSLTGTITQISYPTDDFPNLLVQFSDLTQQQQRQLVELLYCRPGQWKSRCAPNELHSLWLILKSVAKPRIVFERDAKAKPVRVNPV
jgi:cellulose synthase (UDP-forming)